MVYVAVLATGFLAIGLYKLRQGKREAAEGARVLREGIPVEAVVTGIDEERLRGRMGLSWSVGWMVSYTYQDSAGQMHWGKSGFLTEREATRWRTDDPCPVWFDPRKPESSVWAG